MGKKKTKKRIPTPSSIAERCRWLLLHVWDDNRSAMSRDVGCSPSVIAKIAAGSQSPGRRLLVSISSHPKVNPSWLLSGKGEPLLAEDSQAPAAGWPLPIARRLLPGAPQDYPELLSGESFPTAGAFYRETRYWFEIQASEPLLRNRQLSLRPKDLILIETDRSWWIQLHMVHERICLIEGQDGAVAAALVSHYSGDIDDPAESLSVDVPTDADELDREIVIRRTGDGTLQASDRWLSPPVLPRSRRISGEEILGVSMMMIRR